MPKERRKSSETPKDAKKTKRVIGQTPPVVAAAAPKTTKATKDILKDATDFEEKEAVERSGEEDLKLFQEACGELRDIMGGILSLKLKEDPSEFKDEVEQKKTAGALQFVTLKKLNRLDKLRLKKSRDMTHEAKSRVDSFHLQLDNLLYEVVHLQKEVNKCLEFKSKDEEIELVSMDDFVKNSGMSDSQLETLKNDKHKLMLARLEWEYEQRKKLSDELKLLDKSKQSIQNETVAKQKILENLEPKLNAILEAAKPLQEDFKSPFEKIKWEKRASLVPTALHILYRQLKAYGEACEPSLDVSVEGDAEKAKSLSLLAKKSNSASEENGEEQDSDSDAEAESRSKRKRSISSAAKEKNTGLSSEAERKKKLFQKHPLYVQLKLTFSENEWIVLDFYYLTSLNIVTVTCKLAQSSTYTNLSNVLQADTLLRGLFPDDNGDKSPNEANYHQFSKDAPVDLKPLFTEVGRPFVWAQRLAGLEFPSSAGGADGDEQKSPRVEPLPSVSSAYVEQTVKLLKERLRARLELQKLVSSLEKGIIPLNAKELSLYPARIASHLTSWLPSDWDEYVKNPATENLVESEIVTEDLFFFYNAVIERGSARLRAAVAVPLDYPKNVPLFALQLQWHGNRTSLKSQELREMEAEVNVYHSQTVHVNQRNVLAQQLQRLCMCLDVLTEVDGVLMSSKGGSYQTESSSGKPEFSREIMFHRPVSGRSRDYPFNYDPELGTFKQRF